MPNTFFPALGKKLTQNLDILEQLGKSTWKSFLLELSEIMKVVEVTFSHIFYHLSCYHFQNEIMIGIVVIHR